MPRVLPRTGLLVVRIWLEGPPPALRAQVRFALDVDRGFEATATFGDLDTACGAVRGCLEQFLAGSNGSVTE
jgi:hypothetical protein